MACVASARCLWPDPNDNTIEAVECKSSTTHLKAVPSPQSQQCRFDWDQQKNAPADRWARPELNHAVVEFVAPTEYMVRETLPLPVEFPMIDHIFLL